MDTDVTNFDHGKYVKKCLTKGAGKNIGFSMVYQDSEKGVTIYASDEGKRGVAVFDNLDENGPVMVSIEKEPCVGENENVTKLKPYAVWKAAKLANQEKRIEIVAGENLVIPLVRSDAFFYGKPAPEDITQLQNSDLLTSYDKEIIGDERRNKDYLTKAHELLQDPEIVEAINFNHEQYVLDCFAAFEDYDEETEFVGEHPELGTVFKYSDRLGGLVNVKLPGQETKKAMLFTGSDDLEDVRVFTLYNPREIAALKGKYNSESQIPEGNPVGQFMTNSSEFYGLENTPHEPEDLRNSFSDTGERDEMRPEVRAVYEQAESAVRELLEKVKQ
jgi:hypothetical protein